MKKIVKILEDPNYAKKHSHPLCEDVYWKWAKTIDGEIYFKGEISGYDSYTWTKLGDSPFGTSIPLDKEDVIKLYKFIQS